MWAGVRVIDWALHARLGASRSPPTRSVLRQFAHFHAGAARLRFGAAAVAAASGCFAKAGICVGEQRCGQGEREKEREKVPRCDGDGREGAKGLEHEGSVRLVEGENP